MLSGSKALAAAMTDAIREVASKVSLQATGRQAADAVDAVSQYKSWVDVPFVSAVVCEALRLRPPTNPFLTPVSIPTSI